MNPHVLHFHVMVTAPGGARTLTLVRALDSVQAVQRAAAAAPAGAKLRAFCVGREEPRLRSANGRRTFWTPAQLLSYEKGWATRDYGELKCGDFRYMGAADREAADEARREAAMEGAERGQD